MMNDDISTALVSLPIRRFRRRDALTLVAGSLVLLAAGCKRSAEVSAQKSRDHLTLVTSAIETDVGEVRRGLPRGAEFLREYFAAGKFEDATAARDVLDRARNKVQDLRVAKPTFFALVDVNGIVLRSDQSPDLMAGKSFFAAFPELRSVLKGGYHETRGEMPEAARVRGKDGEWATAQAVEVDGAVKGIYAAGWSWSAYAYRLENHLRGKVRSALGSNEHEPLVYVYILVDTNVFGAPVSPEVNARGIAEKKFLAGPAGKDPVSAELEITGREFGAAFQRTPALGENVGVVVLRSET
jgi:hypothetical protein